MKKIASKYLLSSILVLSAASLVACGGGAKKCKNAPHNSYSTGDELIERTLVNGTDCLGGFVNHYKCSLCGEEYETTSTNDKHLLSKLIENGEDYNLGCSYCDRPAVFSEFKLANHNQSISGAYDKSSEYKYYSIQLSDTKIYFNPEMMYGKFSGGYNFGIDANVKVLNYNGQRKTTTWYIACRITFEVNNSEIGSYEAFASFPNSDETRISDNNAARSDTFNVKGSLPVNKNKIFNTTTKTDDQIKVNVEVYASCFDTDLPSYNNN